MKEIILTNGNKATMVDDIDYEYLSKEKWYLCNGYALAHKKRRKMHRIIIGAKVGEIVDHIDRNKLNNTRANLRLVNQAQNTHNQEKRPDTNNKFKGTQYIKRLGLWQSRCRIYGNDFFLGYYKSEIASAYAYNKKAIELSDCILLNQFDISIEELEQKLITDLSKIIPADKKSEQKGVYWNKSKDKWETLIFLEGKRKCLGTFKNEIDAINKVKNALLKKSPTN